MSLLDKAATQKHLTLDTVEVQFCSDWLKDQVKDLFGEIERLKRVLAKELTESDELGSEFVLVRILQDENEKLKKVLELVIARAGHPDPSEACRLVIQTCREALESE